MLINHTGRTVIVTGASQGIGRGLATFFSDEGAHVIGFDVHEPAKSDSRIQDVVCDVTDAAAMSQAVADVRREHGRVDVLINNAGINVVGAVEDLDPKDIRRCLDVNVTGTFIAAQAVIPAMKEQCWGRILNAASFAAIVPSVGSAAYAASKAAVVQFTRVLASELGPWGITANAYAPGMIPTAMNGFTQMPADKQNRLLDTLSIRRWQATSDVAHLLSFIASEQASYLTGTLVDISGGKLATQIPSLAYQHQGLA